MSESLTKKDNISLWIAVVSILVVSAIVLILVGVASYFNQRRMQKVLSEYTDETMVIFDSNRDLNKIFYEVMDSCYQEYLQNQIDKKSNYPVDITCTAAKSFLDETGLVQRMLNGSAVSYVRIKDGKIEMVETSGTYRGPRSVADMYYTGSGKARDDLRAYAMENKKIDLWQNFISYIPGKEVLVLIDNENNQKSIVFRGVIER